MAEQSQKDEKSGGPAVDATVANFVESLDKEHRMLVVLKAQLYGRRWEPMLDDLHNRLDGKPYIFKLANRINDDIERIERMQKFEIEHNVDLVDYVNLTE